MSCSHRRSSERTPPFPAAASVLALALVAAWLAPPCPARDDRGAGKDGLGDPEELVRRLGSDSWQERNSASNRLEALGEEAYGALSRALRTAQDPEIKHAAGLILEKNLLRPLPAALQGELAGFLGMNPARKAQLLLQSLENRGSESGGSALRKFLEQVFLFDPSSEGRDAALRAMNESSLLPSKAVLDRLLEGTEDDWGRSRIGLEYSNTGFHEKALALLLPPEKSPETLRPLALRRAARSAAALGRFAEALKLIEDSLPRPAPEFLEGRDSDPLWRATVLARAGEPGKAVEFLESGLAGDEGERLSRSGLVEAFAAWLSARGLDGDAAKLLGSLQNEAGGALKARILARADLAEKSLEAAFVEVKPQYRDPHSFLKARRASASQRRIPVLRGFAEQALQKIGPLETAHVGLETALVGFEALARSLGAAQAVKLLQDPELEKFIPGSRRDAALPVASILVDAGAPEPALSFLAELDRTDQLYPADHEALGDLLAAAGRNEEALEALLVALPSVNGFRKLRRLEGKILAAVAAGPGFAAFEAELKARLARAEEDWKKLLEDWKKLPRRTPRAGRPFFDQRKRVMALSLLSAVRHRRGDAAGGRAASNLAFALAPGLWQEALIAGRMETEAALGDETAFEFLKLLCEPSAGLFEEEEEVGRRMASVPEGFWAAFKPAEWSYDLDGPNPFTFKSYLESYLGGGCTVDEDLRVRAIELLDARFPSRFGTAELARWASDSVDALRTAALRLLAARGGREAALEILKLLKDDPGNFAWQRECAETLASLALAPLKEGLLEAARSDSEGTSTLASWLLLKSGESSAVARLAEVARNETVSVQVRAFAALGLAGSGNPEVRGLFTGLIDSPSRTLRMAGAVGLAASGEEEGLQAVAREALFAGGSDPAPVLRAYAAVGGPRAAEAIAFSLASGSPPLQPEEAAASLCRPPEFDAVLAVELLLGAARHRLSEAAVSEKVFEAIAGGAAPAAAAEAFLCLREGMPPWEEEPAGVALAARVARRAGKDAEAAALFTRASRMLKFDPGFEARAAYLCLLLDFEGSPEEACEMARSLALTLEDRNEADEFLARALSNAGRKQEALQVLDRALGRPPAPGFSRLRALRARMAG